MTQKSSLGSPRLCVPALRCLFPRVVIGSCWLCQEAELSKSAFPGLCLLRGSEPALSGQQGLRSDRNVNSGGGGREGTFAGERSGHSSPPWQTTQFGSVTPAVAE